jgi:DNA-binding transcriptional ArsR family regulator
MALAGIDWERLNVDVGRMGEHAREASELLKALAHEGRLLILCDLLHGEKSVGELEALLSRRQASVSHNWRASGLRAFCRPVGTAGRFITLLPMIGSARSSARFMPVLRAGQRVSREVRRRLDRELVTPYNDCLVELKL